MSTGSFNASKDEPFFRQSDVGTRDPSDIIPGYVQLAPQRAEKLRGGSGRLATLVIAGDDKDAKARVTHLLDQFGFDTVDAGPLREGWRIQRDTPGYGPRRTAEELRRDLAAAKRYRVG